MINKIKEYYYYIFKAKYFIVKSLLEEKANDPTGQPIKVVLSEWYMNLEKSGGRVITVWLPKPKVYFSYLYGWLFIKILRKKETHPATTEYSLVTTGDYYFIDSVTNGPPLEEVNKEASPGILKHLGGKPSSITLPTPTTAKLGEDHIMYYNGVKVHWVIGDVNMAKATELGLVEEKEKNIFGLTGDGPYWEAWGSCNGRPYQLFAWFDKGTQMLSNIIVLNDPKNDYFHQETYEILTKANPTIKPLE
jgi:hypothetical protein